MSTFAIPHDDRLPGLPVLLDTELVKAHLAPAHGGAGHNVLDCRMAYVRYKPGEKCVTSYVVKRRDQAGGTIKKLLGYGICFSAPAFAEAYEHGLARAWVKPPIGLPVTSLADHQILLFAYPNDRTLEGLRILAPEDGLRQLLSSSHLNEWILPDQTCTMIPVVYKPERRAVFRCQVAAMREHGCDSPDAAAYLKVYPDEQANRVHGILTRLLQWQGPNADFGIPRPLAFGRDTHILILSSLPGTKLTSLISDPCAREAFERTAQALAKLHAYHDREAPQRTVATHLAGARASLRSLVQYMPELEREIEEIRRLLHATLPEEHASASGFVHGDLGLNVLVDSTRIGFIDFDRAHTGPIAADIGSLLSRLRHVRLEGELGDEEVDALKDAFLAAYFKAAGQSLAPAVISWWTALPLIQNALRPLRRLDAHGPDKVKKFLEEARRVLQRK